jgi:hypothetical protein
MVFAVKDLFESGSSQRLILIPGRDAYVPGAVASRRKCAVIGWPRCEPDSSDYEMFEPDFSLLRCTI